MTWRWLHRTGYPEDHWDEDGLTTEEVIQKIKNTNSYYIEDDIIEPSPQKSFYIYEFFNEFERE